MKTRNLGTMKVSALGYGCMGLSGTYGAISEEDSIRMLRYAVERGIDFFDTADAYGPFRNEELVGEALAPHRDKVIIATKFGQQFLADGTRRVNGKPEYVRSACEASLKRLKTDTIDLYLAHRIDREVPIEDTVGMMSRLVAEGKVRNIGLCEANSDTIRRAHKVHPLAAVQTEYSLWTRHVETEVLPTTRELGIGFMAYSPLGRGFLTGAVGSNETLPEGDVRRAMPRFSKENHAANAQALSRLQQFAESKGRTPAQIALAWVLAQGDDIVPIPGTRRAATLDENLAALDIALSKAECDELAAAIDPAAVKGDRYPAAMMATLQ
jgi:aryl-alcohol dehydrogenase-like predicted oxidoreductase